jgi:hypothetical protein
MKEYANSATPSYTRVTGPVQSLMHLLHPKKRHNGLHIANNSAISQLKGLVLWISFGLNRRHDYKVHL